MGAPEFLVCGVGMNPVGEGDLRSVHVALYVRLRTRQLSPTGSMVAGRAGGDLGPRSSAAAGGGSQGAPQFSRSSERTALPDFQTLSALGCGLLFVVDRPALL